MSIEIQALTAFIGAEVSGLDLATEHEPKVLAQLREALLAHLVLVFRDQNLTPESHIAFARHFGDIKLPPVATSHGGPPRST